MYGDPVGLGTNGPLARTVRDAAALLDVMAGRAVGDPFWAPEGDDVLPRLRATANPAGCASRASASRSIADAEVDAECIRAWEDASRLLEGSATRWSTSTYPSRATRCPCSRPAGRCSPRCRW